MSGQDKPLNCLSKQKYRVTQGHMHGHTHSADQSGQWAVGRISVRDTHMMSNDNRMIQIASSVHNSHRQSRGVVTRTIPMEGLCR